MNILGWHKKSNVTLIEKDDTYFVVDKQEKKSYIKAMKKHVINYSL